MESTVRTPVPTAPNPRAALGAAALLAGLVLGTSCTPRELLPGVGTPFGPFDGAPHGRDRRWLDRTLPIEMVYSEDFEDDFEDDFGGGFRGDFGDRPDDGRQPTPIEEALMDWNETMDHRTFFSVPIARTTNKEYDEHDFASSTTLPESSIAALERNFEHIRETHGPAAETNARVMATYMFDGENGIYKSYGGFPWRERSERSGRDRPNEKPIAAITITNADPFMGQADIILNYKDYKWTSVAPPPNTEGTLHLQTILRHELGHVLGLPHHVHPRSIMYRDQSLRDNRMTRHITDIDERSLRTLYGHPTERNVPSPVLNAWDARPAGGRATAVYPDGHCVPIELDEWTESATESETESETESATESETGARAVAGTEP